MAGSYLVAGARTPIGKMSGALAGFSAVELGGIAIKAALERAGVAPDQVDYVFMGQVLHGRPGPDPGPPGRVTRPASRCRARHHASTRCACPGLNTIYLADQMIAAGRGRHRGGRRHGVA